MIVWINGPFGGGKTTLATTLRQELPGAVLFDAEEIGILLRQAFPGKHEDFQDFPSWRPLVAQFAVHCHRENNGHPVLIPMTLLRQDYAAEIHGTIRAAGIPLTHLLLHADPDTVSARIDAGTEFPDDEVRSEKVRAFRRRKLPAYVAAYAQWLATDADAIDTTHLTARHVADRALAGRRRAVTGGDRVG
ncbi:AAA family ATPase [Kitasatospora brasiliensis]|uniref:AAA family ATPase n=1 Tax=Kitasatospora brasiliensis TaxID=3058040 RepID=UPI002930F198|nr:AAA family ATPase [Kitasatospora sp. K002]